MKSLLVAAALALITTPVFAGSASVGVSANILVPVVVTQNQPLAFGPVAPAQSLPSTVTLTPAGVYTVTNGTAVTGPRQPASITISGAANQAVSVNIDSNFTLTGPNGASIPGTTSNNLPSGGVLQLGSAGAASLNVGGAFTITNGASPGAYTGSFTVTADYQ